VRRPVGLVFDPDQDVRGVTELGWHNYDYGLVDDVRSGTSTAPELSRYLLPRHLPTNASDDETQ